MPIIVVMAVLGTSGTLLLDAGLSFTRTRGAAADTKLGSHHQESHHLFPNRSLAGSVSWDCDLLRRAWFQSAGLWLSGCADEAASRSRSRLHRNDGSEQRTPSPLGRSFKRRKSLWEVPRRRRQVECPPLVADFPALNRFFRMPGQGEGAPICPARWCFTLPLATISQPRSGGGLRYGLLDVRADAVRHTGTL